MEDFNKMFEDFCEEYNLDYDFSQINEEAIEKPQYKSYETSKAFLIFKYSIKYIKEFGQ